MKNGTVYAGKLKKFYTRLRQSRPKPTVPEPDDPLRRLALAILGVVHGETRASKAMERLFTALVDWNEVRVSSPAEIAAIVADDLPDALPQCQNLVSALRSIYRLENRPALDRLRAMGRREAKQYLESLEGVDAHAVASVFLWSLGGHAIPVNDAALRALREAGTVEPDADRATVQAFLERHVNAADAREFCMLLTGFAGEGQRSTGRTRTAASSKSRRKRDDAAA
jgi:endonuclease III